MMDGKQIPKTLVRSDDERAVSPVIGVVLMVAITVILAAVIATFVMGMGDSLGDNPQAAVDIDTVNENTVTISLTDLGNADGVVVVDSDGNVASEGGERDSDGAPILTSTGESLEIANDGSGGETEDVYEIDGSGSYTVQAYFGDSPSDGGGEDEEGVSNIDEQVDASAVISEFDLAGDGS